MNYDSRCATRQECRSVKARTRSVRHKVEAGHKEGGPRARGRPARPAVVGRNRRAAPVGVSVGVPIAVTPTVATRAGAAPPVAVPEAGSRAVRPSVAWIAHP